MLLCLCLFGTMQGWAQPSEVLALDPEKALTQYIHDIWKDGEGLPQSSITVIAQTRDGYLWLGTQEGLVRFNGLTFSAFDKRNVAAFARSPNVRVLYEDRSGSLWIGTMGGGLVRYTDGRFTHYAEAEGLTGQSVSSIREDSKGTLWVGTFDAGLFRYEAGRFASFTAGGRLQSAFVNTLFQENNGTLWIGTDAGLSRLRGDTLTAFTRVDGLPDEHIEKIFSDRTGLLWVGTGKGLVRYRNGHFEPVLDNPWPGVESVLAMHEDSAGTLWIGTGGSGLFRYRNGIWDGFNMEQGLTHNRVRALYTDREGSLWIGTDGGGLNRLRDGIFTTYTTREHLSYDMAYAVYEDAEGSVWVGTEGGGVNRLKDGRFTTYTMRDGLSHDDVSSIAGAEDGSVWVGTFGGGVNRLKEGRFTHYTTQDGLAHNVVTSLYRDADSSLWVGTDGGISHIQKGRFTNYTTENGLGSNYIMSLRRDRKGAVWVGTYDAGLNRMEAGQVTDRYTMDDGLSSNMVLTLHEDDDGILWAGTYGGGLSRIKDGAVTTYTTAVGLFNDNIYQVLEDTQGRLWMSCNKGLFWVEKAELNAFADGRRTAITSVAYSTIDGLKTNEMNGGFQPAGWRGKDGRLWFPSIKGVAVVDPAHIRRNEIPPPVVISAIKVNHETLVWDGPAILPAGTNKLEFFFDALTFIAPERVAFKYRLEGYDETWSDAATGRTATYTNLDPGHYALHVLARNSDGVWNDIGARFTFTLKPFFYQTLWFYFLCVLGIALGTFAGYRLRVNQLKAKQYELEYLVDERTSDLRVAKEKIEAQANRLMDLDRFKTRFFANISHEFRTPLTLMIGPLENALTGAYGSLNTEMGNQMRVMLRNAVRLLRLINQLLDLSKLESDKMPLLASPRNVVPFLEGIVFSFTTFVQQKRIDLKFNAPQEDLNFYFEPDKLEKVFFNLLSNAVKFTPSGGTIRVDVEELPPDLDQEGPDGFVRVTVTDSGVGIPVDQLPHVFDRFHQVDDSNTREYEGTGIGLALVRELVLLHGGDVTVESEVGNGTSFTVLLRKGRTHLRKEDIVEPVGPEETTSALDNGLIEMATGDFNNMAREDDGISETDPVAEDLSKAPLVLIVDDNPDIRSYVRSCLVHQYRTQEAVNGEDGWEKTQALRPDLIVTDLMMPKLDGYGLCRLVKADDSLRHIPIILLTAKTSQGVIIESLEQGADEYISKPFNARELQVRISNLIQLREQEKSLLGLNENLRQKVDEQVHLILEERNRYEQTLIEAKDKAEESARLKASILNNMSHEIRTPLTAILGYVQILSMELGQQHREFLDYIEQNGKRLMSTLNAILDLSRLEKEDLQLNQEEVDVAEAVCSAAALFKPIAQKKDIQVKTDLRAKAVITFLDRTALDRILNNLVSNAVKFTESGDVMLRLDQDDEWVYLQVQDQGIGISADFLPHLFEAFKQESSGLTRSHEGSGLGLALTHRLVQLMDGDIAVESEKGQGTTFTLRFPLRSEEHPASPAAERAHPARPAVERAHPARPAGEREPG